jgi:hypothetical protein
MAPQFDLNDELDISEDVLKGLLARSTTARMGLVADHERPM